MADLRDDAPGRLMAEDAAIMLWIKLHEPVVFNATHRLSQPRAAILMPALFALADKVIGNPNISYFIAFGSFAMLLLVDFSGSLLDRARKVRRSPLS